MRKWVVLFLCMVLLVPAFGGKLKMKPYAFFNAEEFENRKLDYANYYLSMENDAALVQLGPTIKKVVITEFNIEFPFYFDYDIEDMSSHQKAVDVAYDQFVTEMAALTGWEFIPKEKVGTSAAYQALTTVDENYLTGPASYEKIGDRYNRTVIMSASGLRVLSLSRRMTLGDNDRQGWEIEAKNVPLEAQTVIETGADAALKVTIQVAMRR